MNPILDTAGRWLARYLSKPVKGYDPLSTSTSELLRATLRPCDVLLVEGNTRVSTAVKYLTQSTWSHAALYIGNAPGAGGNGEPMLIEADLEHGVWSPPLSRYEDFHVRICRPMGLREDDARHIVETAISRIGHQYDLKNLVDLVRYLLPTPPVPVRWRRRLGTG